MSETIGCIIFIIFIIHFLSCFFLLFTVSILFGIIVIVSVAGRGFDRLIVWVIVIACDGNGSSSCVALSFWCCFCCYRSCVVVVVVATFLRRTEWKTRRKQREPASLNPAPRRRRWLPVQSLPGPRWPAAADNGNRNRSKNNNIIGSERVEMTMTARDETVSERDVDAWRLVCVCGDGRGWRTGLTSSGEWPVGKITEKISFLGTYIQRSYYFNIHIKYTHYVYLPLT